MTSDTKTDSVSLDRYQALIINKDATEAEKSLLSRLSETTLSEICYAYKSRVKSPKALIDKVAIKQEDKPEYQLLDITDVVGIRFVTLFRRDMPNVLNEVLALIGHKTELSPNPFKKNSIEEVITYHVPHIDDPIFPELDKQIKEHGLVEKYQKKAKGEYSSIHIVARLDNSPKDLELPTEIGDFYIPIEIQIRTVFEDAWGEIDHKYGYVFREGKDSLRPVNNSDSVQAHLKVLKKFVDASAQYADEISREATTSNSKSDKTGELIPVGDDLELIARFNSLLVDNTLIESYKENRIKRAKALEKSDITGLLVTAKSFQELSEKIDSSDLNDKSPTKDKLFYFYCKMNEAFCLLSTKGDSEVQLALSIYLELYKHFQKFPVLLHRLGQTYGHLGQYDEAIFWLSNSLELVEQGEINKTIPSDELPNTDYKHLKGHTPLLLGYNYWAIQHYSMDMPKDIKLDFVQKAYSETKVCLGSSEAEQESVINNLLYYLVDITSLSERSDEIEQEIKDRLSELEVISPELPDDLELLDTLAEAQLHIGDEDKAKAIYQKIINLSLARESKPVDLASPDASIVLEITQNAWKKFHTLKQPAC